MSVDEPEAGTPAWWENRYHTGDTPWDTGIVPPELVRLLASEGIVRGWALDLGCGSGLNSRFLARHGFHPVGVDFAFGALRRAVERAAAERSAALFCAGDVSDLSFLAVQAALAIDIGCLHSLPPDRRRVYIESLARHMLPGALYLLYAFCPSPPDCERPGGLGPADLAAFAPWFSLCWAQHGREREHLSAWYLFQRTGGALLTGSD